MPSQHHEIVARLTEVLRAHQVTTRFEGREGSQGAHFHVGDKCFRVSVCEDQEISILVDGRREHYFETGRRYPSPDDLLEAAVATLESELPRGDS